MKSINPLTSKTICSYEEYSNEKIDETIDSSYKAYLKWKNTEFSFRSSIFINTKNNLNKNKNRLANLMAEEMGKPLHEGVSEIEKCAWVCEYYAENAEKFLAVKKVDTSYSKSEIHFSSIGPILAIMPWNYPFWQAFRFLVPTLMAGNTALLKHASNVTGCALEIEKILKESELPKHVFSNLVIEKRKIKQVIENYKVKAVTLTGSTEAGKAVAQISGASLKKSVFELGGSDPYIILADADIKKAAELCAKSRLLNGGQSCISAKRFIVMSEVYDEFLQELKTNMQNKNIGDPKDPKTDLGPMAKIELRDELHKQVLESIDKGAECILGGKIEVSDGAFYPPTILSNISKGMPAYSKEFFGPVALVLKVKNINEAISVANDTSFGLGSGIFTSNTTKALEIASEIDAGACFINDFVKSDPRLPFGGVKESGYGRELGSYGIHEFVNIKTICIK